VKSALVARPLYVSRTQLLAVSASMRGPAADGPTWKAVRPEGSGEAVAPWFSLTPRSPSVDSRIGGSDVELSATMATFGGITGPRTVVGLVDGAEPPPVVLGGNPVAPGTPAGLVAARSRQCAIRLRLAAEGIAGDHQCLVLAAVCALSPDCRVQVLLGELVLGELVLAGEDRLALLVEVPEDGHLVMELWLRLCSPDPDARLGVRGIEGHLL
jgi:hypothetical protein